MKEIEFLNEKYEEVISDLNQFIKLFVDEFNLTNLIIVGNGYGSSVAIQCAVKSTKMCYKLVILNQNVEINKENLAKI